MKYFKLYMVCLLLNQVLHAQNILPHGYDIVWNTPSENAAGSMPCGGGDIGLNVWVENGDLLFYMARSGNYDENNALLKPGRVRIHLSPNPFSGGQFKQTLNLNDGCIDIEGKHAGISVQIKIWVDVFRPDIHVEINSPVSIKAEAGYENWRYRDSEKTGLENNENGYKYGATAPVKSFRDSVRYKNDGVWFYHRNNDSVSIFDLVVKQQGLGDQKTQLFNPLKNLISGGALKGWNMKPSGTYLGKYGNTEFKGWRLTSVKSQKHISFQITLQTLQTPDIALWENSLEKQISSPAALPGAREKTLVWWHEFWARSFIYINPDRPDTASAAWQSGRNYQLFRYMLACNAFGSYPTKFNGGLFTYDPVWVNPAYPYTPDFRNWGGSVFTTQNQRLLYYPMLKSGDTDMIKPAFDFYLRILKTAEIATQTYWHHAGARFPEQIENFGLSNLAEYGIHHPRLLDAGVDDNPWLEYHWETVLEFCLMMLETETYSGENVQQYVPFIESCLDFFDLHYQYLAKLRGSKTLDGDGKLIFYPGSAGETFKMAYNSTPTVAGLHVVITRLLNSKNANLSADQRRKFTDMLTRIPAISIQTVQGHQTIAPARSWERINNEESPQLYPVFPYGIYGLGKPGLELALNTWKYDTLVVKFKSYTGWKQDNIVAARLGLTDEAASLTFSKLKNSGRRFPAFWGPGFDWTPDHNWGGSAMTGLQEMLLQTVDDKILLLPAWPANLDVHFLLHAEGQTTVECAYRNGKIILLKVTPAARLKDVKNMLEK